MNSLIGIKTNWYTKVKKTHVSKQLDYITYKIRLHHIQNICQRLSVLLLCFFTGIHNLPRNAECPLHVKSIQQVGS